MSLACDPYADLCSPRKDIDIVLYSCRQIPEADKEHTFLKYLDQVSKLTDLQFLNPPKWNWINKAIYKGVSVDFLCPEAPGQDYHQIDF